MDVLERCDYSIREGEAGKLARLKNDANLEILDALIPDCATKCAYFRLWYKGKL